MFRFAVLLSVMMIALTATAGAAQPATPASTSELAAYPELNITITASGFELPSSVPAGRYLVTATNTGSETAEAEFLQLPAGVTQADLHRAITSSDAAMPGWVYQATQAGGVYDVAPGGKSQVIIDLSPGAWFTAAAELPLTEQPFTVTTGTLPSAAPEPQADATIELQEFAMVGLPTQVTPGRHIWKVTNTGKQPHFLELGKSPRPITPEQLIQLLQMPETATPPPGSPALSQIEDVSGMNTLSPGKTAWLVLDVEPGSYVAACFFPDEKTGMPHALLGMVGSFTVEGAGTPAAT